MKSEYEIQAETFLTETNTRMKITFVRNDFCFDDDKEKRDIYKVTLSRGSRSYSFEFGMSFIRSGFYYTKGVQKIQIDRKYLANENLSTIIRFKMRDMSFNPICDKIHKPIAPTPYDILAGLTKYNPGTFENFCSEFGYDTDSKTAEKTYNAVVNEYTNLCTLFSDAEMEKMEEIQ